MDIFTDVKFKFGLLGACTLFQFHNSVCGSVSVEVNAVLTKANLLSIAAQMAAGRIII